MPDAGYWPILIAGAIAAASTARRRIIKAAQPLRLELAEKGERLRANPKLPEELRDNVEFMLDTAFKNRGALIFGLFAVPIMALMVVIRPSYFISFMDEYASLEPEVRALHDEVMRLHDRITLANHPILLILLEFEIIMFMPVGILLLGLLRGYLPKKGGRDMILSMIEVKEAKLFGLRKFMAAAG